MRMTVTLQLNGRSIQIPCGACGALLKISLMRQDDESTSSAGGARGKHKPGSLDRDGLRLLIESLPTDRAPRPE
jgi:hypothetical protein